MTKNTLFVVATDYDRTSVAVYKGEVSLSNHDRDKTGELSLSRRHIATVLADGSVENISIFNAEKALSRLDKGIEPDISEDGFKIDETDENADDSDRDDDKDKDDGDDDKNKDDGNDNKDKDDGDIKDIRGNIDRFKD